MGRIILEGKKCVLYRNESEADKRLPILYGGGEPDPLPKDFEVYLNLEKKPGDKEYNWYYFPDDTPLYSKTGWNTLEEAKIFYLLMEI